MSQNIAAGQISNTARLESEMQADFELIISLLKETTGGSSIATGASYQIASNTFTVADNLVAYQIDTAGGTASTATLNTITAPASCRDGMVIWIQPTANNRVITLANAAGGTGQIFTKDGNPIVLRDKRQWTALQYDLGATAWRVILNDETFRINQLLGGANATTLINSSNTITPTAAVHLVDTSGGAAENVTNALTTSISDLGRLLILYPSNAPTRVPTLKHMSGGAGQFSMSNSADYVLATVQTAIMFQLRSVASVLTWVEVTRFSNLPIPSATLAGQGVIGNGAGAFVLDTPPTSSPGYVQVLDTSANGTNGRRWQPSDPGMPQGRLTVLSGSPLGFSSSASTIYYTPYKGQYLPQWNVTSGCWIPTKFSELSFALSAVSGSAGYYVYVSSATIGTPSISLSTTAPTMQNGALCKSGDPTALYVGATYLGTGPATANYAGSGIQQGSLGLRNYYNRMPITLSGSINTSSYTYASATVRGMSGSAPSCSIVGHAANAGRDYALASVVAVWKTSASSDNPTFGIGLNSTTAFTGLGALAAGLQFPTAALVLATSDYFSEATVDLSASLSSGTVNYIYGLESMPAGTATVYGVDTSTGTASGITVATDY